MYARRSQTNWKITWRYVEKNTLSSSLLLLIFNGFALVFDKFVR